MDIEERIREIVREEIGSRPAPVFEPELITIDKAAEVTQLGKTTLRGLIQDAETNGFPAFWLSEKRVFIDKRRLLLWIENGGVKQRGAAV